MERLFLQDRRGIGVQAHGSGIGKGRESSVQKSETAVVAAAVSRFFQLNRHLVLLRIRDPDPIRSEALRQLEAFDPHDGFPAAEALLTHRQEKNE